MAYDSNQSQDVDDMFDYIEKKIYQDFKDATTGKQTAKKIPSLSCELMISHLKSPNTFWNAIQMLANKQGDNVKLLKNTNSNNQMIAIIPNTKNNGNQKNYYKYHLSIFMDNNDNDDDKSNANKCEQDNEFDDDSSEKILESGDYKNLYNISLC